MSKRNQYSRDPEIAAFVEALVVEGWAFVPKGSARHAKVKAPDGFTFPVPGTPTDHRAGKNWRSQIKKAHEQFKNRR